MIVMNIFVRIMCSTFFTAHQGSRKTGMRLERRCLALVADNESEEKELIKIESRQFCADNWIR